MVVFPLRLWRVAGTIIKYVFGIYVGRGEDLLRDELLLRRLEQGVVVVERVVAMTDLETLHYGSFMNTPLR